MLYIQNRDNYTLGVIENFYNDTHQKILSSGVSTYDFTVSKNQDYTEFLVEGNYIVLADDNGEGWKFTIMNKTETHESITVQCDDIGLELLNTVQDAWSSPTSKQPIEYYIKKAVKKTEWVVNINEISSLERTLKWEGRDTSLARLLSIATEFDNAELEFKVEFKNLRVVKQYINIFKARGTNKSEVQLIYGDTVDDITKTTSITDLRTSLKGVGSAKEIPEESPEGTVEEHVDFSGVYYDDGEYFSPSGDPFLYARTANQQFNIQEKYIEDFYEYDTSDAQELFNRTITQLKKASVPLINYEVSIVKFNQSLELGDTVTVIDHDYQPELLLNARVLQINKSYTDSSLNSIILGNFIILESNIDSRLSALQNQLQSINVKPNYTWLRYAKDDKGTDMTSTPTTDTKYVAIISNKSTGVPSDNLADYAGRWQLIKGNDGKDGIPGATGADGKTSYTHFAYADNVSGTADFSLDDPTGRSYMGVYSDFTKADSNNPNNYVWSYTKGETGPEGMQGAQGPQGDIGIPGKPGADGKTSYTHVAYADNDEGGGFSQNPANKAYMGWYSDFIQADSTDITKYAWSLIKGSDGLDGAQGIPGPKGADGKTPYTHIAYANSADGITNFSTSDSNRTYIGMYVDFNVNDSTTPSDYSWTLVKGADGSQGTPGKPGTDGKTPYLHTAYSWSADGTDRFMTVYPNLNLVIGTSRPYKMGFGIPNTSWEDGYAYLKLPLNADAGEVLPQDPYTFWYTLTQGVTYTQTIWFETDATVKDLSAAQITWFTKWQHDYQPAMIQKLGQNSYNVVSTYTWPDKPNNEVRLFDTGTLGSAFDFNTGTYLKFGKLKLEQGDISTPYTPSPLDDPEGAYPQFIGTYTDYIADDSTDPSKHTWVKIRGEQGLKGDTGKDGVAGKDGVGIKSTQIMYAQSTSGTTAPTTGWAAQVPTLIKGQYLWTQTTWVYTDSTGEAGYTVSYNAKDGNSGKDGIAGKDGVGIKSTLIEYAVSSSGITKPTTGWSVLIPSVTAGQFLWTRTTWSYTDSTNEVGYSVAQAGATGPKGDKGNSGTDGVAGKDGIGIKSTAVSYQASTNGTTAPAGTWSTTVPTVAKGSYLWTRTIWTYTDNTNETGYSVAYVGTNGNDGTNGVAGKDGVGIKSTTITYAQSTSGTVVPTTGYTTTVPSVASGSFLWTKTTWSYTDGTSESGYSVAKMGEKGAQGPQGLQGLQGATGNQGIQGPKGLDGKSSYTHIAYGTSNSGAGFTQTPSTSTTYIGMYVDQTATDSADPNKYAWSLIKGADGAQGTPGAKGADGKTPYFHSAWADSKDGKVNFSTTDPTNRGYLGTYTDFTQADSTDPSKYFWVELVGALSIGGRNYLADTGSSWQAKGSGGTNQSSSMKWLFTFGTIKQAPFKDGEYVTVSFDYTNVGTGAYGTILPQFNHTPLGSLGGADAMKDNGHVVRTVQWKSGWTTSGLASGIQVRMDNVATTRTVTAYNMQFERGNKDTDHKVAPEDTQQQIDTINQGLVDTNSKIAAVTKVDSQATAPTNPKKGDQWWVKDANGNINAFKIWNGTKWADSIIQQSAMNIGTLNGNIINGATINGSEFTNNFDFTGADNIHFQGVTQIKDGAVNITWKIPENNQTGETKIDASGLESIIRDPKGAMIRSAKLQMGQLQLGDGRVSGALNEQDVYQNYTNQVQYLDGWYGWNNPISITRRGKMVTFSGYIAHNGGSAHINIAQFPAWARPEHTEFIVEIHFGGDTGTRTNGYGNLMLSTSGRLIVNRGLETGQHASFGYTFVGQDI